MRRVLAIALLAACAKSAPPPAPVTAPDQPMPQATVRRATHEEAKDPVDSDDEVLFTDTAGAEYTRGLLAGHVIVVSYFATWCAPCRKQLPALQSAAEKFRDNGLAVIGVVAKDNPRDEELAAFLKPSNVTFPIVRLTDGVTAVFGEQENLPTTLLINEQGVTVTTKVGLVSSLELDQTLESMFQEIE